MDLSNLTFMYEGKAKKLYEYDEDKTLIYYKDDVTANNGEMKDNMKGKGIINKKFSVYFFRMLEEKGIKTHFVKDVDENSYIAEKVDIIPLEVIVRNYTAGSFCRRYGVEKGMKLEFPLVEFSLKDDDLGDPMISKDAALAIRLTDEKTINYLKDQALKVNEILNKYFLEKGIILVDYKLEFGMKDGKIILADEISPDTCRFWDSETKESLDKDVYRESKGNLVDTYSTLTRRLGL
ncbi:MAG: phosphoribosylaminoimidazolesuccinocarboxamide synthase [Thermotogota bacterium]